MASESTLSSRRTFPDGAHILFRKGADGWPLRSVAWAEPDGPPRGSILFLGGRGDHFEKYLESFADWRARGWQVESVDWRGQGGSGRLSGNPHVGHCNSFGQWIDDIAGYAAEWQARTAGPHIIIGHSMGGHLVLRALAERRIAPDAAVLIAPMLGFTAPYPDSVGHWIARMMCRIGDPARAAWQISEKPGSKISLRQMLLTHDDDRYADELWWRAKDPTLELGPASWRWVEQAYASFHHLGQPELLERVTTPVLVLIASADKLVNPAAAQRLVARLPHAQSYVYGREAAHELLREVDAVRDTVLTRIEAFLDERASLS
ncbi:MAG: alpha/beta hydrolase [Sphingopyxis sp.]